VSVFSGEVQFAETIEKHSSGEGISSLAFVEAGLYAPTQFDVAQKIEREDRSFQPSQLAQRSGGSVLTWAGGELAKDDCRRHGSLFGRSSKPEKIFPMLEDQLWVKPRTDQRFEPRINSCLFDRFSRRGVPEVS
jgi:hypothetical protein